MVAPAGPKSRAFDSLISVDAPNVIVESIKWAETGKAVIVRLYEASKTGCHVNVTFDMPVRSVHETNLMEEKPRKLKLTGRTVSFYIRPFEIKTLRLGVR
jgi:alpha-mannosidase